MALRSVARTSHEQSNSPWRYSNAGVVTIDLVPLAASQGALFDRLDYERLAVHERDKRLERPLRPRQRGARALWPGAAPSSVDDEV
ncbi:hypothetical protein [Methylorubrum aminovorans]